MKVQIPLESLFDLYRRNVEIAFENHGVLPWVATSATIAFFEKYEASELDCEFGIDSDMLLFQYSSYDLPNLECFCFDITRQFKADDDQDEFYQIHLTLYYELDDCNRLSSYNTWSIDLPSLELWHESVCESEGFKIAEKSKLIKYEIILDTT